VEASNGMPKRRDYSALSVVYLFFPVNREAWLIFLAVILFIVAPFPGLFLLPAALIFAVLQPIKGRRRGLGWR
jgi:hypothetical protein